MKTKRTLLLLSISAALVGNSAWAGKITGPWMQAYQAPSGLAMTQAQADLPAPKKCYSNAKRLLCAQLVQTLSKETINKARLLANTSVATDTVYLPTGAPLVNDSEVPGAVNYGFTNATRNVELYRVTYRSKDVNGNATKLSGLVVVPEPRYNEPGAIDGMVVYMHSTTADINNASGDRSEEAYGAITAFAGNDWVLAMPDYLGYGVNKKPHPYALGKLNAQSGIDMIRAARELAKKLNLSVGSPINITGYSEGGGNSMWLGRALDEQFNCLGCPEPDMIPTRVAPMSGPYDLSGATAKSFVEEQPPLESENITVKPTLLAFAGVATAQVAKPKIPANRLLQDELASQAKGLYPGPYSDNDVGARMLTVAIDQFGYMGEGEDVSLVPRPDRLLQSSLVEAITTQNYNNPAMKVWQQNDAVDWSPNVPIYMLGVIQDPLVPFASKSFTLPEFYKVSLQGVPAPYNGGNAENVIRAMRKKGYDVSQVSWLGFNGRIKGKLFPDTTMTHSSAFVPCTMLAFHFFKNDKGSLNQLPHLSDPLP